MEGAVTDSAAVVALRVTTPFLWRGAGRRMSVAPREGWVVHSLGSPGISHTRTARQGQGADHDRLPTTCAGFVLVNRIVFIAACYRPCKTRYFRRFDSFLRWHTAIPFPSQHNARSLLYLSSHTAQEADHVGWAFAATLTARVPPQLSHCTPAHCCTTDVVNAATAYLSALLHLRG